MKEPKNCTLSILKLVFLLHISKSRYYKNKKVTYKFRRDPQLELIITKAFHTNKKFMVEKELQNILHKTTISKFPIGL